MPLLLPSLDGLIKGDAQAVGYRYVPPTEDHPPLRIFYPAQKEPSGSTTHRHQKPVGWFDDRPHVGKYMSGYLHIAGIEHGTCAFAILKFALVSLLSWLLPLRWRSIPDTYANLPIQVPSRRDDDNDSNNKAQQRYPVIVFSHGLTGTGQENSALCAAWARQGFVVVAVHHMDGSSACVPRADGSTLFYQQGPPFDEYDTTFRPKQVEQRAKEMVQALNYLRQSSSMLAEHYNFEKVIGAGFSFGAATAALAAVQDDSPFVGLILIDGWFYIDVSDYSPGVEFEFPALAFERGLPQGMPTLFINSEQFRDFDKLYKATCRLASGKEQQHHETTTMHMIPGTKHNNFCEVIFWLPRALLGKVGAIGSANVRDVYQQTIDLTTTFLRQNF